MTTPFTHGMAKATELTRAGRLREATALIQSLLRPAVQQDGPAATGHPASHQDAAGVVIDGTFTRLEPTPLAKKPATSTAASAKTATPKTAASKTTPRDSQARVVSQARVKRTPLAETLRKIAAGGLPAQGLKSGNTEPMPQGAQFLMLTHAGAHGSRSYRLYIPANHPKTPMPLIVMLHGCTQTPEDFAAGTGMNTLAEEFGCLIAYPAQPSGANAQKCWNWYRPEDQVRNRGEPALIAGLTRDILRDQDADPARVYVAGLSAGGAAAILVAAAYPDIFSAVGVHSGLPAGGAHDIPSAFAAMRGGSNSEPHRTIVPTIVFHGLADSTVHPENGTAVLSQALQAMPKLRATAQRGVSDGGHRYRSTIHAHPDGRSLAEHWEIEGAGHAWAGGNPAGSYTDARGPDASRHMMRFFLQHKKP
ncbi:MAG: alpha/beta hydrolase family esterase [Cypionkella sp.]